MLKKLFIPTLENNYTPRVLSRGFVMFYTFFLLTFNLITADIESLKAKAQIQTNSLVTLHNQERTKRDLPTLKTNSKLVKSAQLKANAMMAADCWDHYCPNGKSPWAFFNEVGYDYIVAGENLAEGFNNNQTVMNAWMNSSTHRANVLKADYTEIGIAIAYGNYQGQANNSVIVVHFGARSGTPSTLPSTDTNPTPPPAPQTKLGINSPSNDQILNTNTPSISGTSADGSLAINDNGTDLGTATADEGIFTYKIPSSQSLVEGRHTIKVDHQTTKESASVKFEVDTIAPTIDNSELDSLYLGEQTKALIKLTVTPDTLSIEADQGMKFTKITETQWQLEIDYAQLESASVLSLSLQDDAGNVNTIPLDVNALKDEAGKIEDETAAKDYTGTINVRRSVNLGFIMFIILALTIDYFALSTTNIPIHIVRSRSAHHLPVFILLFIIAITGGGAGEIINALST